MNPSGPEGELQQVATLTARMLEASERADWRLVSELEAQRYHLLSGLPPACLATHRVAAQAILGDALAATQCITERIRGIQTTEQSALEVLRHGTRATLSYLAVAESA